MNNTKKLVVAITLASTLIGSVSAAESTKDIKIEIDGKNVISDVAPFINNERTLVPIRVISENLGYNVNWDNNSRKVTVKNSDKTIELFIGKKKVNVNGKDNSIDVAPIIKNERTFVPLRFISESFDNDVKWDNNTRTVKINRKEKKIASLLGGNNVSNTYASITPSTTPQSKTKQVDSNEYNNKVFDDWRKQQDTYTQPKYSNNTQSYYSKPKDAEKNGDYYARKMNTLFNSVIKDNMNYEIISNIAQNVNVSPQLTKANDYGGIKLSGSMKNNTNYTINFLCYELVLDNGKIVFYTVDETVSPNGTGYIFSANHPVLYGLDTSYFHNYRIMSVMADVTLPSGERRVAYNQNDELVKNTIFNTDGFEKVSDPIVKRKEADKKLLLQIVDNLKFNENFYNMNSNVFVGFGGTVQNNSPYVIKNIGREFKTKNGSTFYVSTTSSIPIGGVSKTGAIGVRKSDLTEDDYHSLQCSSYSITILMPDGSERLLRYNGITNQVE